MTQGNGRRFLTMAGAMAIALVPALALGRSQQQSAQDVVVVGLDKQLAAQLKREIARMAPEAACEDLEATIIYVLSQREYERPIMSLALDDLGVMPAPPACLGKSITQVRLALLRRQGRGTAAILTGGGGYGYGSSSSFSPLLGPGGGGGGGGSSAYTL